MLLTSSFILLPVGPLQKLEEEKGKKEKERLELERERRERDKERERERERRDREKEKERERERDKERERERDREREKTKERERERERERSRDIREDRSRSKSVLTCSQAGENFSWFASVTEICAGSGLGKIKNETETKTRRMCTSGGDWRGGSGTRRQLTRKCVSVPERVASLAPRAGVHHLPLSLFSNLQAAQKLGDPGEEEVP